VLEDFPLLMAKRGGHAIGLLHWLHGLRRLGHDVLLVEFLDEKTRLGGVERAVAAFQALMGDCWPAERTAVLLDSDGTSAAGLSSAQVARFAAGADALIEAAAHYRAEPWPVVGGVRPRIMVDQDPGYTHLWAQLERDPRHLFGDCDFWFTVGLNVGSPRCPLPTLGLSWRGMAPPVVLPWWGPPSLPTHDRFTTVASWRDYGWVTFDGQAYGPKADEFLRFLELPRRTGRRFELALHIEPDDPDRDLLRRHGWQLRPHSIVDTPARYRRYIRDSLAEFSVAKGVYAGTNSGWFSDRSACYLAAGRPVVLQSTGFGDVLPTGEGLFAVRDLEEAADAVAEITRDYPRHSKAARALAAEFFDSDHLLAGLLAECGVQPRAA
jgi:hypothetical protein